MGLDFLVPVFGILIVLVPIIGLTTVLTLRYGLKPFIQTLAQEMRGTGVGQPNELQLQIRDLNEQIADMTAEIERLRAAQEFDRKLLGSKDEGPASV